MLNKFINWLFWFRLTLYLNLGLYIFSIFIFRLIRENKNNKSFVPRYGSPVGIERALSKIKWKKDSLKSLNNYINSPENSQWKIENQKEFSEGFDCDDFSFYFAYCVSFVPNISDVKLLITSYKSGAHITCCFTHKEKRYHYNYGIKEVKSYYESPYLIAKSYNSNLRCFAFLTMKKGKTYSCRPYEIEKV
jgi:hypothetical protein